MGATVLHYVLLELYVAILWNATLFAYTYSANASIGCYLKLVHVNAQQGFMLVRMSVMWSKTAERPWCNANMQLQ